jgi:adenylate cyclase
VPLLQSKLQCIRGTGNSGLAAAEKAVALQTDLAEAHAVLRRMLFERGQQDKGAAEIQTALRLDSECFEVNRAARLLSYRQRPSKTRRIIGTRTTVRR